MHQTPDNTKHLVSALVCLHNLMRIRYPGLQNAVVDREDDDHCFIPHVWRNKQLGDAGDGRCDGSRHRLTACQATTTPAQALSEQRGRSCAFSEEDDLASHVVFHAHQAVK